MKSRFLAALILATGLGGCALPVPLQIASFVADGVSLLTTQKTMTDHGLSALTGQDCAVWRGFSSGEGLCEESDADHVVLVAEAPASGPLPGDVPAIDVSATDDPQGQIAPSDGAATTAVAEPQLVAFETAAGPPTPMRGPTPPVPHRPVSGAGQIASAEPIADGLYYVIGSFGYRDNAERQRVDQAAFAPTVAPVVLDGHRYWRVLVGPMAKSDAPATHRHLLAAGVLDPWALVMRPVAEIPVLAAKSI